MIGKIKVDFYSQVGTQTVFFNFGFLSPSLRAEGLETYDKKLIKFCLRMSRNCYD